MQLLLGFNWPDAVDYATERGWTVFHARHAFTTKGGETVNFCRGLPGDDGLPPASA